MANVDQLSLAGIRAVIPEEVLEEPLRRTEEVARNLKMIRFPVVDLRDLVPVEAQQRGAGITEDDRRMRRNQKLRMAGSGQVVNDLRNDSWRCGDSAASGSSRMYRPCSKRCANSERNALAMRLLVQGLTTIPAQIGDFVEISGDVIETLGPQEEAFDDLGLPRQAQGLGEQRAIGERRPLMVATAAFGTEAAAFRERLE